jgi:Acyl-CoA synthetases (AMP-forming)/AMP-acid ligases II
MERSHLASLVADFARYGGQTAIVSREGLRGSMTSYADLASLSGRFASELERRRIVKGDRVLIWGENSAEWIAAFFGCLLGGVLAVPLDAASSPDFVQRVAEEVTPKLCVGGGAQSLPVIGFPDFEAQLPRSRTIAPSRT